MKLRTAHVQHYKSIDDSGEVAIDTQVTCLVGKNESGKTAFLQAIGRVHPVAGQPGAFDYEIEYPRKDLSSYKRRHDREPDRVVTLVFELSDTEIAEIERRFGKGVLLSPTFSVSQGYDGGRTFNVSASERSAVSHLVAKHKVSDPVAKSLADAESISALVAAAQPSSEGSPEAAALLADIASWRGGRLVLALIDAIDKEMPEFFYFDDYSVMRGRISVPDMQRRIAADDTDESDRTFMALLELVGNDLEEFASLDNRERLIASLEAAGNEISDELFEFWSQNRNLEVKFDLSGPDPSAGPPYNEGTNLQVRIYNSRHRVTVPFDQRSRGFVWFFSFLAYFSQLQHSKRELVLLLDEPGLSLHASAQGDFLRFIEERLAPHHQVVYTTHSPFMVEADRLDRVRTVEDQDRVGTKVSSEVLTVNRETIFPLQAALGYSLAQTLFVGSDNLLVEGPSDYLYLKVLSDHLKQSGRDGIDDRWVIVPVGGLEKIPTFLALLNTQLNVAAIIDGSGGGVQRVQDLADRGVVTPDQIIPVTAITGTKNADIEDLFDEGFYLTLFKAAGLGNIVKSKLTPGSRIVKRIEAQLGHAYDHYRPARHLLENPSLLADLAGDSLDRFERLFETVNRRISS